MLLVFESSVWLFIRLTYKFLALRLDRILLIILFNMFDGLICDGTDHCSNKILNIRYHVELVDELYTPHLPFLLSAESNHIYFDFLYIHVSDSDVVSVRVIANLF